MSNLFIKHYYFSRLTDLASGVTGERVSRISLVDLAGSERALKTGINK